jgi:hypothetical protein
MGYSFKTTVKLVVDGQVIDSQTLERKGAGPPPQSIRMDKVSVKGRDLHAILKAPRGQLPNIGKGTLRRVAYLSGLQPIQQATPVVEGHQVCFYTDYEGVVIFRDPVTGEETPAYRKLDNANRGCFDFAVAETGDFEMRVERNVTVAPIAEVMTSGEIGMGTLQTETVTQTITVPVGPSEYRTVTVTSVKTKVVTTTVTTTVVSVSKEVMPITVTVTKTVVVSAGGGGGEYYGGRGWTYLQMSGIILIQHPYDAFIFIGKG